MVAIRFDGRAAMAFADTVELAVDTTEPGAKQPIDSDLSELVKAPESPLTASHLAASKGWPRAQTLLP